MAFLINNPKAGVVVTDYDYNIFTELLADKFYKTQITKDYSRINRKDLSLCTYSFVIKNISRFMSTLIMELQDSYTEQSLRYCVYDSGDVNGYIFHKDTMSVPTNIQEMMDGFIEMYTEITRLRDIEIKGRPKREHYLYNVLPEEARMILPVSVTTNMMITLDGSGMIGLFSLMKRYPNIFDELRLRICGILGPHSAIYEALAEVEVDSFNDSSRLFNYTNIDKEYLLNRMNAPITRIANAGRISSNTMYDTNGISNPIKDMTLANNIVGYGHTSISEHTHISFSGMLTVPGYQQLIRHRHHNVCRKNRKGALIGDETLIFSFSKHIMEFMLKNTPSPESYMYKGKRIHEWVSLYYYELVSLYNKSELDIDLLAQLLLNCTPIEFNVSGNMLSTMHVMSHRICNNAQPEISNMYRALYTNLVSYEDPNVQAYVSKYGAPSCVTSKCNEGRMSCGEPLDEETCTTLR